MALVGFAFVELFNFHKRAIEIINDQCVFLVPYIMVTGTEVAYQ